MYPPVRHAYEEESPQQRPPSCRSDRPRLQIWPCSLHTKVLERRSRTLSPADAAQKRRAQRNSSRGMDRARHRVGEGLTANPCSEQTARKGRTQSHGAFRSRASGTSPVRSMPAEPPWVHWGQWRTGFWEPDAPPDGEDNMRRHRSASFSTPGRAGNISLWYLIAAFMAGLALLHLIAPTEARAQTSADSTAVLHWTAPGDDGTTGRATSYALRHPLYFVAL